MRAARNRLAAATASLIGPPACPTNDANGRKARWLAATAAGSIAGTIVLLTYARAAPVCGSSLHHAFRSPHRVHRRASETDNSGVSMLSPCRVANASGSTLTSWRRYRSAATGACPGPSPLQGGPASRHRPSG
jgi:hypothetical protein